MDNLILICNYPPVNYHKSNSYTFRFTPACNRRLRLTVKEVEHVTGRRTFIVDSAFYVTEKRFHENCTSLS